MIEQEIVKLPDLELYRNFEGQDIIKLQSHGQIIVKSRAGNTYPVRLHNKTRYDEDLITHPTELVAVIDNDSNPWVVEEIRRKSL